MDNKDIMDGFGDFRPDKEQVEIIEDIASKIKDKSEDEVFVEIIRINSELEDKMSPEKYQEIFEKLENIRYMLSDAQNEKLDKVLKTLNKGK